MTAVVPTIRRQPQNIAWLDAIHFVETRFPGCDRRRRKREYRKALRKALAGTLPGKGFPVFITPEPIELANSFDTATMTGSIRTDWDFRNAPIDEHGYIDFSKEIS